MSPSYFNCKFCDQIFSDYSLCLKCWYCEEHSACMNCIREMSKKINDKYYLVCPDCNDDDDDGIVDMCNQTTTSKERKSQRLIIKEHFEQKINYTYR